MKKHDTPLMLAAVLMLMVGVAQARTKIAKHAYLEKHAQTLNVTVHIPPAAYHTVTINKKRKTTPKRH